MSETPSDRILISGIDCVAAIGVTPEERVHRQRLSIDVELFIDTRKPAGTDSLKDTIDYAKVAKDVAEVCGARDYHLIETVAGQIVSRIWGPTLYRRRGFWSEKSRLWQSPGQLRIRRNPQGSGLTPR